MTDTAAAVAPARDHASAPPPTAAPWVLCLPVALMLSYAVALRSLREEAENAGTLIMLLAPLALVLSIPRRWARDRHAALHAALVGAWTLWTAALIPLHPEFLSVGVGWLGIACAGAVLFLAVSQADGADRAHGDACLQASAVACGLALVVCAVDGPVVGFLDFGFGNINHTICALDAPLLAGAVLIAGRLLARAPLRPVVVACVAGGILALLWLCLSSPIGIRRGGIVAGVAATACALASWGWARHRRATILACCLAAGVLCGVAIWKRVPQELTSPVQSFRYNRIALYRACLDRAAEVQPTGDGAYAVLRIPRSQGEHARHWTAAGNYMLGAHNDLLDALIDGGIPAVALWLAMAASLTIKAWRVDDPAQRAACAALLAVLFVHAMTDNAYAIVPSVRVLMALPCALVFCCPARGAAARAAPPPETGREGLPVGPRLLALPLMAVSTWCAMWEFSSLTVAEDATPRTHLHVLGQTEMPQSAINEFQCAFQPLNDAAQMARALKDPQRLQSDLLAERYIVDTVERRVGTVATIPYARAAYAEAVLDADVDAHAGQEALDRDAEAAVRALLEVVRIHPFDVNSYHQLRNVMGIDDAGMRLVPRDIAVRCDYIVGASGLTEPSLEDDPGTVDEAADRFAVLWWWTVGGHSLERATPAIRQLVLAYGDIDAVSELGVRLIERLPGEAEDLISALEPGMRIGFQAIASPELQGLEVMDSFQADHPQPTAALLKHYFPKVWDGVVAGRYRVAATEDPSLAIACGRVYAALRAAERPRR